MYWHITPPPPTAPKHEWLKVNSLQHALISTVVMANVPTVDLKAMQFRDYRAENTEKKGIKRTSRQWSFQHGRLHVLESR